MESTTASLPFTEPDFRALFDATPLPCLVLVPDFTIVAINDACLQASRSSRPDMLGRNVFDVLYSLSSGFDTTGIANLKTSLHRVLESKLPDTMPIHRYSIPLKEWDGFGPQQRSWKPVNVPVLDANGEVTHILHRIVDITDQQHTEDRLRKNELRYRGLFEAIDEGFCIIQMIFDRNGRPVDYLFCETNPVFEKQTGLDAVVGKTIRELAPAHETYWFDIYGKVAVNGEPIRFENEAKALKRWFDVYAFRIDEPNANKVAVLFKDITGQKRTEEELRKNERLALEAARLAKAERRRLNAVLNAAPVGIVMANVDGSTLQTNRENRRLWGQGQPNAHNAEELKEWKGWWADGSRRQGQRLASHDWPLARALRGEDAPDCIIEIEPFDTPSEHRTVLASGAPIRNGAGKIAGAVVALMDITDRVKMEASLRETAARLQFVLASAQLGDWEFDLVTGKNLRSLRHDQCFGYDEPVPDWSFDKFLEHVHPDDRLWIKTEFEAVLNGTKEWHFECRVIWPDGSTHWIAVHGSVYATNGKATHMTGVIGDVTKRKEVEEMARHASLHDPLTGLPNRAMLFEYASHLLPHNRRTRQFAAVLFLDLDRFKPVNDTHGHEVGDAVLKEVARRLAASLRADDIVIRLGGDEFVILLQDIKNPAYAAEVARQVIKVINDPFHIGELSLSLSASIGISIFHRDGEDIDTLISHADMAMYQAKQAGRNNFQFYSSEFSAGTKLQLSIEQQLKAALSTESFHLCYQPVMDISNGEIVSVEALLRWQNPEIGPDRFVPVAEATGIINPIGRWLVEEASRQHRTWINHGLPPIPIAVNVSVVEFRDRNFAERFEGTLREQGIDTGALQLELTETAVMDDIEHAVTTLSRLKDLGVTILLDDFGTGHSSLAYLARLPLDKVKIDKSFISRLESDVASRAVTDAMIALGRTLNLEIVAEGIESAQALDYISAHGCNQGQGFYLGEPMSGDSFESWYWDHDQRLDRSERDMSRHH